MTTNSIASILSLGAILIFIEFMIPPFSYANYDELPVSYNISAISIYNLKTFSVSLPYEPSRADYNITDPNFISLIYSGLSKNTSTMIDKIMAINVGVIYCLFLGMGEKPSPSGEDFSRFAILWNIIARAPILFMISRFILFGSRNIANRSSLETWPSVCVI